MSQLIRIGPFRMALIQVVEQPFYIQVNLIGPQKSLVSCCAEELNLASGFGLKR